MPRPRTLDPSNIPDAPNPAKDPERIAELLEEFRKRLEYLRQNYLTAVAFENDCLSVSESLNRIRRRLNAKKRKRERGDRVHPAVEIAINLEARRLAKERAKAIDLALVEEAALNVVSRARPIRGRPSAATLRFHVVALYALIIQFSGVPVLARRYSGINDYQPHFANAGGRSLLAIVQSWDERVTETQLVNLVNSIRVEYAGKPLRFEECVPTYGMLIDDAGVREMQDGLLLRSFSPVFPIYCP